MTCRNYIITGAEQLGMSVEPDLNVYLEDGTLITDTRVLDSEFVKGQILILGTSPPCDNFVPSTPGASPTIPSVMQEESRDEAVRAWTMSLSSPSGRSQYSTRSSTEGYTSQSLSRSSSVTNISTNNFNDSIVPSGSIGCGILRLPDLTSSVTDQLLQNNSNEVWNELVSQTVNFYRRYYPDRLTCSEDYRILGQGMLRKFPTIARFGKNPWSCYTHAVSSRMRSLRHSQKKRSSEYVDSDRGETSNGGEPGAKRKLQAMPFIIAEDGKVDWNNDDYKNHKKEMKGEWEREEVTTANAKHLLKVTFESRQMEMKMFEDRWIHRIMKIAPILQRDDCVSIYMNDLSFNLMYSYCHQGHLSIY